MDKASLVARRAELQGELRQAQALAFRLEGAIVLIDELIEQADGEQATAAPPAVPATEASA